MSITPGPWHVFDTLASEDDDVAPVIEVRDHFDQYVATINDTEDAELIAKAPIAPKLADALRDLMASCQKWAPTIDRSRARAALTEWDSQ